MLHCDWIFKRFPNLVTIVNHFSIDKLMVSLQLVRDSSCVGLHLSVPLSPGLFVLV